MHLVPHFAFIFFVFNTCSAQSSTITLNPAFYDAIEGDNNVAQFICNVTESNSIFFLVDGDAVDSTIQRTRNITVDFVSMNVGLVSIAPLLINNNTVVRCFVLIGRDIIYSQPGLLRVYQRLPSPPRLSILNANTAGVKLLSWERPFTMKITELNIIRYRVCFSFSDISVLEQCMFTQLDSYSYPNIRLTLIFSVTASNMFGYSEKSEISHFPCRASMYLQGWDIMA